MPVAIEQDFLTQRVKIYVYTEDLQGHRQFLQCAGPGEYRNVGINEGELTPPPLLELSRLVFLELVREIKHVKEPSEATQAHLDDAIAVRDRLLTMVERDG